MIQIFKTLEDGILNVENDISDGCWIALTRPDATELENVASRCGVDLDDLRAPLDEEERSRLVIEDNYTSVSYTHLRATRP